MDKYKRKTGTEIDAVLVTADNINELAKEFRGKADVSGQLNTQTLMIPTLTGNLGVLLNEYLLYDRDTMFVSKQERISFETDWEPA